MPTQKLIKKMSRIRTFAGSETSKENEPDPDSYRIQTFAGSET